MANAPPSESLVVDLPPDVDDGEFGEATTKRKLADSDWCSHGPTGKKRKEKTIWHSSDMEPCPKLQATFLVKKKFADQILDGKKIYEGRPHSKSYHLQVGNFIGFSWCSATVKLVCEVKEILFFEHVEHMVNKIGATNLTPDLPSHQERCDPWQFSSGQILFLLRWLCKFRASVYLKLCRVHPGWMTRTCTAAWGKNSNRKWWPLSWQILACSRPSSCPESDKVCMLKRCWRMEKAARVWFLDPLEKRIIGLDQANSRALIYFRMLVSITQPKLVY